jgi:hypothetical protein
MHCVGGKLRDYESKSRRSFIADPKPLGQVGAQLSRPLYFITAMALFPRETFNSFLPFLFVSHHL